MEVATGAGASVVEVDVPPDEDEVTDPPFEDEVTDPPFVDEVTVPPLEDEVTDPPFEDEVTDPPFEDDVTEEPDDELVAAAATGGWSTTWSATLRTAATAMPVAAIVATTHAMIIPVLRIMVPFLLRDMTQ
ncbi:MAG: hypothetical protein ACR2JP_04445 [Acidimicrobiia bacterium]